MTGYETALGLLAGALTTFSFLPQIYQIWKSRSAKDISFKMYFTFSLGVFLWLLYGLSINSVPVITANATTLIFNLTIIFLKWKFSKNG